MPNGLSLALRNVVQVVFLFATSAKDVPFRFFVRDATGFGFVDRTLPNRAIPLTWPKVCWPHCEVKSHPSFQRSQRTWEQRMQRFVYMKYVDLKERSFELRDFHGSFALDFEVKKAAANEFEDVGAQLEGSDSSDIVFVDVGANLGMTSINIASRLRSSRVIALEPNPVLFRVLQWNIRVNNVTNVWPLNIALSQEGSGQCSPADGLLADCTTIKVGKNHRAGFIHPEASCKELEACFQVPAWSLKNVMKHLNLQRIHHLKLNCEGCEYHVLNDPVIRRMKEEGYIGNMSGELHHFDTFNILPEMVEPAMNIMCQEKLVWSCLVGMSLLIASTGLGSALYLVLGMENQVENWQLALALSVTCVPCCAVAGCLAILSAILELELTSKAFACDMMPEDLKDNV
eukprot:symbB.v1.2.023652.t1/scaffold2175.1/size86943/7